jgi:hypothetical protein
MSLFNYHFIVDFMVEYLWCKGELIRLEDHMRMFPLSLPLPTTTISHCPQCGAVMRIKLVEPDLKDPCKARHVFECQECGLPRTYLIDRERSAA